MNKIILAFFVFSAAAFPSLSHAQVPFGGYDVFRFPVTCSLPPFVPLCNPFDDVGGVVPAPTDFPIAFFDFFIMLNIAGFPSPGGYLAVPFTPLLFPTYALVPNEWAIGFLGPLIPVGGIYIPSITWYQPPQFPCGPPPVITVAPGVCCLPSMCIPVAPTVGTVAPFTGAAPGGFF